MRRAMLVALVALCACSVSSPEHPQPTSIHIEVTNPSELVVNDSLRYAVVWTFGEGEGISVTTDGPLESAEGLIEVKLELLGEEMLSALDPVESLGVVEVLRTGSPLHTLPIQATVYRPRFIVYSDVNANGRFEPAVITVDGPDMVLAIDDDSSPSVAAFLDLDRALSQFSLEEASIYYRATGGIYTPFVRATERYPGYPGSLLIDHTTMPVALVLSDSPIPETRLACRRERVWVMGSGVYATSRVTALVDIGLDAVSVCGAAVPDCNNVDLDTVEPPSLEPLETEHHLRLLQCRASGSLEALVVHEAKRVCEECACNMRASAQAFIIDPASPPAWWPCGDTVDYCDSQLPLYVIDPECVPEDSDG